MTRKQAPPESSDDLQLRIAQQGLARVLAEGLAQALPAGTGFALLLFDFGEHGHLAYASNGSREDMIAALRECIEKMAGK